MKRILGLLILLVTLNGYSQKIVALRNDSLMFKSKDGNVLKAEFDSVGRLRLYKTVTLSDGDSALFLSSNGSIGKRKITVGGGGAVSSVNGNTGSVTVDINSALSAGNDAGELEVLNVGGISGKDSDSTLSLNETSVYINGNELQIYPQWNTNSSLSLWDFRNGYTRRTVVRPQTRNSNTTINLILPINNSSYDTLATLYDVRANSGGGGSGWGLTGNSGTNSGSNYIGTSDNASLSIRANGVEAIRVDSTTRAVGFGTSSPTAQLTVNGSFFDTSFGGVPFKLYSSANSGSIAEVSDDDLFFLFDKDNVGYKVGIGTATPAYKLDVNGSVYSSDGFVEYTDTVGLAFYNFTPTKAGIYTIISTGNDFTYPTPDITWLGRTITLVNSAGASASIATTFPQDNTGSDITSIANRATIVSKCIYDGGGYIWKAVSVY